MLSLRVLLVRGLLVAPGFFLMAFALARLGSAVALEKAFPAPAYLKMNVSLPPEAYRAAVSALADVDVRDGETGVLRADAAALAGIPAGKIIPDLEVALEHAPADARGWTLLAELRTPTDPTGAAAAFGVGLDLSPYNYWLAARQARDGIRLWTALPEEVKTTLAHRTRLLWTEEGLRSEIRPLLQTGAGVELMTRAFAGEPEELRALNRWLAAERRRTTGSAY